MLSKWVELLLENSFSGHFACSHLLWLLGLSSPVSGSIKAGEQKVEV